MKILIVYLFLILFAIFPVLVSVIGGFIASLFGYNLNEGNSSIGAFGCLSFFTVPLPALGIVVWTIICIVSLFSNKN